MGIITYVDENDFIKKQRALEKYFAKCYKYLIYDAIPKLKTSGKKDGVYEVELPSEELFKKVYGPMKLKFSVYNDVAILEDLIPSEYLINCYMRDMPVYKGIPYDTKKDLFKIKLEVTKNDMEKGI